MGKLRKDPGIASLYLPDNFDLRAREGRVNEEFFLVYIFDRTTYTRLATLESYVGTSEIRYRK